MKNKNVHTARLFRATRERLGLSIRAMANRLTVPTSTLSRIEGGQLAPKERTVAQLLEHSGAASLKELFILAYR